jgi:hypothetical protein
MLLVLKRPRCCGCVLPRTGYCPTRGFKRICFVAYASFGRCSTSAAQMRPQRRRCFSQPVSSRSSKQRKILPVLGIKHPPCARARASSQHTAVPGILRVRLLLLASDTPDMTPHTRPRHRRGRAPRRVTQPPPSYKILTRTSHWGGGKRGRLTSVPTRVLCGIPWAPH